jgi:hypothetical protein
MAAVIIIFGVTFQKLNDLQGPLASLNLAAHVIYRAARLRLYVNLLAYALPPYQDNVHLREHIIEEVTLLREAYNSLLYGGPVKTVVSRTSYRWQVSSTKLRTMVAWVACMHRHRRWHSIDCCPGYGRLVAEK